MKKAEEQQHALLGWTIDAASDQGLDEFSLRHVAGLGGISTTIIFQHFRGRAELLEGALALAIQRDRAFHQQLLANSAKLLTTHLGLADFLASYVRIRALLPHARLASEMLLKLGENPQCHELIAGWHQMRTDFWIDLLGGLACRPAVAQIISQCVLMEEFYACALHRDMDYALLLAETCRALSLAAFQLKAGDVPQTRVSLTIAAHPLSMREPSGNGSSIPEQLLKEGLRTVVASGLKALNQRTIARELGVSTSTISYHFKDMKEFRKKVIWRALVNDIPGPLDPDAPVSERPKELAEWLARLDAMLQPGSDIYPAGFYIGFSRMTAETCLLSRHDTSLIPLIAYLRALEGWGTYHVSRNIEPLANLIGRDHAAAFGLWIKAEALLRRTDLAGESPGKDRLDFAARMIFPH